MAIASLALVRASIDARREGTHPTRPRRAPPPLVASRPVRARRARPMSALELFAAEATTVYVGADAAKPVGAEGTETVLALHPGGLGPASAGAAPRLEFTACAG